MKFGRGLQCKLSRVMVKTVHKSSWVRVLVPLPARHGRAVSRLGCHNKGPNVSMGRRKSWRERRPFSAAAKEGAYFGVDNNLVTYV
jgi:hypothetical protein